MSIGIYVALIFPVIAGLLFFIDLNKYLKILREYRASRNWQSALGQITSSTVEIVERKRYNDETHGEEVGYSYFPKVEYAFDFHGETQEDVRVAFGAEWIDESTPSKFEADEVIRRYPIGAPVIVYFDPQDPSHAVLERRIVGNYTFHLVWKFLLFLGGIGFVFLLAFHK